MGRKPGIFKTHAYTGIAVATRGGVAAVLALLLASAASAGSFQPARYSMVTGTNSPLVNYLAWHVALDHDHLLAAGAGPTNETRAFVMKRHLGGADKWNVVAALGHLQAPAERLKVAIAGDVAVVADPRDDTMATNAGAVHVLMRNEPAPDAWGLWTTLYPAAATADAGFGVNVATDGRYIAVADSTTNGVHLFARNAGGPDGWGLVKAFASAVTNESASLSVSIQGDLLAIGDCWSSSSQVVRLHERNTGGADQWGLFRTLVPGDGQTTNDFGCSVALHGRLLAVGARRDAGDDGAVYLFERDQGGSNQWGQVAKRLPGPGLDGRLGSSVAAYGDTVAAAAPYESGSNPPDGGALYVFQRNAGGSNAWGRTAWLPADADTRFLGSTRPGGLALHGDTLAAGNYWQTSLDGTGGARLFQEYACPTWTLQKKVPPGSILTNVEFGTSVILDESFLAAGRPGASLLASNEGGVVTFERNLAGPDAWGQRLATAGGGASATNARTGSAMALSPQYRVTGSPGRGGTGRIEIRDYFIGGGGTFTLAVTAPDNQPGEQFGAAVAVWDDVVLAGSPLNSTAGASSGAAFVFSRNTGGSNTWGLVKRLDPSPLPASAEFGRSAALCRDIAAVGAPYEEDFVNGMGAVYVFQANRDGSNNWGQVRRIKVPDTGAPYLGWSVALWGDLLAVGAIGDDEDAADSGAVFVFERNRGGADQWGLLKKIKAPTPQSDADFGWSVALRGDRLVVGEPRRDADATDQGRVFVFERHEGGTDAWGLVDRINTPAPQFQALFGAAVAMIDDRIAVGAPLEDIGTATNAGAVYLFQPGCLWVSTTNDQSNIDNLTSVREAVALANASTQATFLVRIPDGTFVAPNTNDFVLTNTSTRIVLAGQGARRTAIDKQGLGRVFWLAAGTTGEIRDLTIRNGRAPDGAGSTNLFSADPGGGGGAILLGGNWSITRCAIVSNTAGNGGTAPLSMAGDGGPGGGIYVDGSGRLEVRDSFIAYNRGGNAGTNSAGGRPGGHGGGIGANYGAGVTLLNSTVYGNTSGRGNGGYSDGDGGGIHCFGSGSLTLRHTTVSHNNAGAGGNLGNGGGVHAFGATLRFSIVNNNSGHVSSPDVYGTCTNSAYNLVSDTNGVTFTGTSFSNIVGVLALLGGSPADYGGPTDTMLPQPGSPVIDKGDAAFGSPLAADQRGYPRPNAGITIDLGAVETTTDYDRDGVPDAWEQARGTDFQEPADAAADFDGDGLDGFAEYIVDSNPYGSPPFGIVTVAWTADTTRITVPTSASRLYTLQSASSPLSNDWISVAGAQNIPGPGGDLTFVRTNILPNRIFRVRVQLP